MHQADVHAVKPHIVSVVVRKLMNQYNELRMHAGCCPHICSQKG